MLCDVEQHVCPAAEPEPEPDAEEEAEPPYAAELAGLSVKLLKRRAKALGATAEQIEGINFVEDRKAAAVQLALSLHNALDGMVFGDLVIRLRTMGATEEQLDDLDDEEDAKVAAIALIVHLASGEGAAPASHVQAAAAQAGFRTSTSPRRTRSAWGSRRTRRTASRC